YFASGLEVRSSVDELLPSDLPSVRETKALIKRVGGDGTVFVIVEALDGPSSLPAAEQLARHLAADYRALGPGVIRSVEANMTPVAHFYEDHWPLFFDLEDLKKAHADLVKAIGNAKSEALFGLGLDEGERDSETFSLEELRKIPLLDPSKPLPREQVGARFARFKGGYMLAEDGQSVMVVVRPAGTSLAMSEARALLARMRAMAASHAKEMKQGHLRVGFAGSVPIFVAEYDAIITDVFSTFGLCIAIVLLSLVAFYREIRSTLALGVSVLGSVAVTFGLTRFAIGYLNTQTAFLGAIVVGNGINYGLIYLARVSQLRRRGRSLEEAVQEGARVAARATLLASLATSVSFGTLIVAANRGFRHFGFIGGIGMALCWVFTFALVPAHLTLMERIRPFRPRLAREGASWQMTWLERIFARPRLIVALFAALTAISLALFLHKLPNAMELNLDNLTNEIKGDDALKRDQSLANSALGKSSSTVLALLPSREVAEGYCDAIRARQKDPRFEKLIDGCETVSTAIPSHQAEKLAIIRDIARRLTPGVLSRLPLKEARRARIIREDLAAQRTVEVAQVPPSLLDSFRERDGTLGRIAIVTARPEAHIELAPNLRAFAAGVRRVPVNGQEYDAAGETPVYADLLSNIQHEGPLTTLLSFLGVCLLVLAFMRHPRGSILVIGSLTTGIVLMGGVATLLHIKINFFNFIVYPITFGVAVDYGANVLARMRERGNVLPALREVGPAVALCSWTSIVGYGSLLFSLNRALRSFGWYAMSGEIMTISTALILLPALFLAFPSTLGVRGTGLPTRESPSPPAWADGSAGGKAISLQVEVSGTGLDHSLASRRDR
ncbi:MAG TPA: MMPL family transporter, partial [Anaeromyxobacteraceae bacterium]|nr:MMPL family transporter [Anaeromyxobacteraceae bacterium]